LSMDVSALVVAAKNDARGATRETPRLT